MAETSKPRQVIVLGAGVIGLSIAHVLSSEQALNQNVKITIVARDMPEDLQSQGWASPWAGANWSPIGGTDERLRRWEMQTFNKLWDMIPSGLAMSLPSRAYHESADALSEVWYQNLVRDFKVLPPSELPPKYKSGFSYTTLSVNPMNYLPWLQSELLARGVEFVRKHLGSLDEAAELAGPEGIVINATSLGSRSLMGVEDTKLYPVRGQTIRVYAPSVKGYFSLRSEAPSGTPKDDGLRTYIIPRPGPDDTVLMGGTYQKGNWDTSVDIPTAKGIFARCAALVPALTEDPRTRILSHHVGLRPAREGGPRVEVEWVNVPLEGDMVPMINAKQSSEGKRKMMVIHAYGFGGAGYQNSWGAAEEVVSLFKANI